MMKAVIEYGGGGVATIWGNFSEEDVKPAFYRCANDMFGIRKSIMKDDLVSIEPVDSLPHPWSLMKDATLVLEHNCGGGVFKDVAVWNSKHEKIKSEWD